MKIYKPTTITDEMVTAFENLMPQLGEGLTAPSKAFLQEILDFQGSHLFLAQDNQVIVGTLTLVIYKIPTGKKAKVEDVIIDKNARGKGIATKLLEEAIQFCKKQQITKLDLTSNPTRQAAHALYLKMGFTQRDTCVFRLLIEQ